MLRWLTFESTSLESMFISSASIACGLVYFSGFFIFINPCSNIRFTFVLKHDECQKKLTLEKNTLLIANWKW